MVCHPGARCGNNLSAIKTRAYVRSEEPLPLAPTQSEIHTKYMYVKGKFPTKQHLKKHIQGLTLICWCRKWRKTIKKRRMPNKKGSLKISQQLALVQSLQSKVPYTKGSDSFNLITRKVVVFVANITSTHFLTDNRTIDCSRTI